MKKSAGILMYRFEGGGLFVLLAHPGGPLFARKDEGVWTVPKGEYDDENALEAARREFEEETGFAVDGEFMALAPITQKGGKVVHAWAVEGDLDPRAMKSNSFEMEWPPRSGKIRSFPEIDRVEWFTIPRAAQKIKETQRPLLFELERRLGSR